MMVTVSAFRRNGGGDWFPEKHVECSEDQAREYVKMFFDMGYEKVKVR
jgi:hypothetical protein